MVRPQMQLKCFFVGPMLQRQLPQRLCFSILQQHRALQCAAASSKRAAREVSDLPAPGLPNAPHRRHLIHTLNDWRLHDWCLRDHDRNALERHAAGLLVPCALSGQWRGVLLTFESRKHLAVVDRTSADAWLEREGRPSDGRPMDPWHTEPSGLTRCCRSARNGVPGTGCTADGAPPLMGRLAAAAAAARWQPSEAGIS